VKPVDVFNHPDLQKIPVVDFSSALVCANSGLRIRGLVAIWC